MEEDLTAVIPPMHEAVRHTMPISLTLSERLRIRLVLAMRRVTAPGRV